MKTKDIHSSLLIIFDFDGVLVNSKDAYAAQMKDTIENISKKTLSLKILSSRVGNTDQKDDFKYFLQTEDEDVISEAVKMYDELTPKYEHMRTLYPGIRNIVETLFDKHYTGIVSRKSQKRVEYWLNFFKIQNYFDYPIGTVENTKSYAIKRIKNHYSISDKRTLMIGDTEFDIKSAKEAGVISVAATYGSSNPDELIKLQPDYII
ncbi:MAG: HAD family hydrolase, partial [Candidatus Heimdallarchaeota archaeon]|nr:HAD family hydrolase [Candidatus Heimdallarchaeota archaeon]